MPQAKLTQYKRKSGVFIEKDMKKDFLFIEFIDEYLSKNSVEEFIVTYCSKADATAPAKSLMTSSGQFVDGRVYRLDWSSPGSAGGSGKWIMRLEKPTESQITRKAWQF